MTSSQCCLCSKVAVEGELMSKKSLSPKIFKWATAILLTLLFLAFPNAQSSHGLKVLMTWIPIALAVAPVIALGRWPSSTCKLLVFLLHWAVPDWALSWFYSHRNSTLATQLSWVLMQQSRIISSSEDLTTMLFWWLLFILFPCKSLHVKEKRIASTFGAKLHRP